MEEITIESILKCIEDLGEQYEFIGDKTFKINGFSSAVNYVKSTITWCKNMKIVNDGLNIEDIECAITPMSFDDLFDNQIKVDDPKRIFFEVVDRFWGQESELLKCGHNTYISDKVVVGDNTKIGHNCTIDGQIEIGSNTIIQNNVVIMGKVSIGDDCVIQSGTVIGNEGLAFTRNEAGFNAHIRHYGGVHIGNRVHINANCEINRGVIDDTWIADDVSISGGTSIGHNSRIGNRVTMSPACRLCGSVVVGDDSYLSGATVLNQVKIGSGAVVGLGSVVVSDIKDGGRVLGYPAKPAFVRKIL